MPIQQAAMARRLRAITDPLWVKAMTDAYYRPQVLPLARLRRPARPRASQEYNRSCQGNTGCTTLAPDPRAQAAGAHGSRYHS